MEGERPVVEKHNAKDKAAKAESRKNWLKAKGRNPYVRPEFKEEPKASRQKRKSIQSANEAHIADLKFIQTKMIPFLRTDLFYEPYRQQLLTTDMMKELPNPDKWKANAEQILPEGKTLADNQAARNTLLLEYENIPYIYLDGNEKFRGAVYKRQPDKSLSVIANVLDATTTKENVFTYLNMQQEAEGLAEAAEVAQKAAEKARKKTEKAKENGDAEEAARLQVEAEDMRKRAEAAKEQLAETKAYRPCIETTAVQTTLQPAKMNGILEILEQIDKTGTTPPHMYLQFLKHLYSYADIYPFGSWKDANRPTVEGVTLPRINIGDIDLFLLPSKAKLQAVLTKAEENVTLQHLLIDRVQKETYGKRKAGVLALANKKLKIFQQRVKQLKGVLDVTTNMESAYDYVAGDVIDGKLDKWSVKLIPIMQQLRTIFNDIKTTFLFGSSEGVDGHYTELPYFRDNNETMHQRGDHFVHGIMKFKLGKLEVTLFPVIATEAVKEWMRTTYEGIKSGDTDQWQEMLKATEALKDINNETKERTADAIPEESLNRNLKHNVFANKYALLTMMVDTLAKKHAFEQDRQFVPCKTLLHRCGLLKSAKAGSMVIRLMDLDTNLPADKTKTDYFTGEQLQFSWSALLGRKDIDYKGKVVCPAAMKQYGLLARLCALAALNSWLLLTPTVGAKFKLLQAFNAKHYDSKLTEAQILLLLKHACELTK